MTATRWYDAVAGAAHPAVAAGPRGEAGVVVKRVSSDEAGAHRLAARLAPEAVPTVLDCWPVAGASDDAVLVTADCGRSVAAAAQGHPGRTRGLLRRGLVALATVHDCCAVEVEGSALPVVDLPTAVGPSVTSALADASPLLGPSWVSDRQVGLEQAARALPRLRALLATSADRTLVHGDVHPGNLVVDASGAVRIVDWGSAGQQAAAWDLAWFDDDLVGSYAGQRARDLRAPDRRFAAERRAAQVLRAHAALADLLADLREPASPLAPELRVGAVQACVDWCLAAFADTDLEESGHGTHARDEV